MLFASCLFELTLTAVYVQPEYHLDRSITCICKFCDHLNVLYIFDQTCIVLKSGCSSTVRMTRLVVSPPSLSSSHPPMPPPRRWPALVTLPPSPSFSSFGAACVKLCCLALTETPVSAVSSMSAMCPRLKVVLPRLNRLLYFRTDSDVRSLNTTIAEGPIEKHKSRLASRETCDGLTGT